MGHFLSDKHEWFFLRGGLWKIIVIGNDSQKINPKINTGHKTQFYGQNPQHSI
jgi:hypothetical protein